MSLRVFKVLPPKLQIQKKEPFCAIYSLTPIKSMCFFFSISFLHSFICSKVSEWELRSDLSLENDTLACWNGTLHIGFMSPFAYLDPTDADEVEGISHVGGWDRISNFPIFRAFFLWALQGESGVKDLKLSCCAAFWKNNLRILPQSPQCKLASDAGCRDWRNKMLC